MKLLKILLPSAIALAFASCAPSKGNEYDTGNTYGTADGGGEAPYQPVAPATQTYDTPAAYEETGSTSTSPNLPAPTPPPATTPTYTGPGTTPATATAGVATTHTVVKGDTLGGIAKKYKVGIASIKQANGMTSDTVVLGKTLKIPAH